jgi:hypothetical protein
MKFGSILLIEKVDVFMEARSSNSLQRNEFVSFAFHLLNYRTGTMSLNTDRLRSIHASFEPYVTSTLSNNPLTDMDRTPAQKTTLRLSNLTLLILES